jgi:hypothetical protein
MNLLRVLAFHDACDLYELLVQSSTTLMSMPSTTMSTATGAAMSSVIPASSSCTESHAPTAVHVTSGGGGVPIGSVVGGGE